MKLWRTSLLLFAAAGAGIAADPPVANLLPPGAALVFGIRVRPLVDFLEAQGVLKDLRLQSAAFLPAAMLSGVDPFHDIDELILATTGTGQNPPALAIVTGRFHPQNTGVIEHDKGSKQVRAFLDESTFLAGDLPLVQAALHSGAAAPSAQSMSGRIESMRARYAIWGFADKIENTKRGGPKEFDSIDGFSLGAGVDHGLEFAAELHVRDPKDVAKLSALLRGWEKLASVSSPGTAPKLDIQTTEDTVKIAVAISEEEIRKAIAAQRAETPGLRVVSTTVAEPKRTKPEVVSDELGNTLRVTLPGKR